MRPRRGSLLLVLLHVWHLRGEPVAETCTAADGADCLAKSNGHHPPDDDLGLAQLRVKKHNFTASEPAHVTCTYSGTMCAGNQCCPRAPETGGKTYPCPSADPSWNGCEGSAPEIESSPNGGGWPISKYIVKNSCTHPATFWTGAAPNYAPTTLQAGQTYTSIKGDATKPVPFSSDGRFRATTGASHDFPSDEVLDTWLELNNFHGTNFFFPAGTQMNFAAQVGFTDLNLKVGLWSDDGMTTPVCDFPGENGRWSAYSVAQTQHKTSDCTFDDGSGKQETLKGVPICRPYNPTNGQSLETPPPTEQCGATCVKETKCVTNDGQPAAPSACFPKNPQFTKSHFVQSVGNKYVNYVDDTTCAYRKGQWVAASHNQVSYDFAKAAIPSGAVVQEAYTRAYDPASGFYADFSPIFDCWDFCGAGAQGFPINCDMNSGSIAVFEIEVCPAPVQCVPAVR